MRRLNIVVGYTAAGEPEVIYIGQSGEKADEAFSAAGAPEFTAVEMFKSPMAAKRRRFEEVPVLGTEEDPKTEEAPEAPKTEAAPKKLTKAELKKAEKAAQAAEKAAKDAEESAKETEEKPEF